MNCQWVTPWRCHAWAALRSWHWLAPKELCTGTRQNRLIRARILIPDLQKPLVMGLLQAITTITHKLAALNSGGEL